MNQNNLWWEQLESDWDRIKSCINRYHPKLKQGDMKPMRITAGRAQQACDNICADIKTQPMPDVNTIYKSKDTDKMISLLNQTWFGVPESTDCWGITGFREIVALLEDVPLLDEME